MDFSLCYVRVFLSVMCAFRKIQSTQARVGSRRSLQPLRSRCGNFAALQDLRACCGPFQPTNALKAASPSYLHQGGCNILR